MRLRGFFVVLAVVTTGGCSSAVRRNALQARRTVPTMERQIQNAIDAGDGDYEAKVLRARLEANPVDVGARLELARHYQQAGFPEVAIEHCRLACERVPESVAAHLALARILDENGRSAEALSGLEKFGADTAPGVEVWTWLGLLRDKTGNLSGAETAHRHALALAPGNDELHNNLGYSLLRLERRTEAAVEFRAALKINSRSVVARNNLGQALAGEPGGDHRDAVLNLQSVTDPASAHNNMAAVLIEAGRFEDARAELTAALGYNSHHAAALRNLGLISELDGKAAEVAFEAKQSGLTGRLDRFRISWVRYWTGKPAEGNSAAQVASRKKRETTPKL